MEQSKHTPGPWHRNGRNILNADCSVRICQIEANPSKEQLANADMLESAPDMLAALEQTLDALFNETHGHSDTSWIKETKDKARAAIAKARGEK